MRVSPGDSEPTRIQSRASSRVSLPRGATRAVERRAQTVRPSRGLVATASPMMTRSSRPSGNPGAMSSPMSTQVSARFVTGTPAHVTTSRLNSPRCPTRPRRRTAPSRASRMTWIECSSSSDHRQRESVEACGGEMREGVALDHEGDRSTPAREGLGRLRRSRRRGRAHRGAAPAPGGWSGPTRVAMPT